MDWATAAGIWACAALLKLTLTTCQDQLPAKLLVSRAWCLQHVSLRCLPLQHRCLHLELLEASSSDASAAGDFVPAWCSAVEKLFSSTAAQDLTRADMACVVDLYDGRLWHFMTGCLTARRHVGLPPMALEAAARMHQVICQLAGIPTALDPSADALQLPNPAEQSCSWHLLRAQHAVLDQLAPVQPLPLPDAAASSSGVNNALVDAILGVDHPQEQGALDDHMPAPQGGVGGAVGAGDADCSDLGSPTTSVASDWELRQDFDLELPAIPQPSSTQLAAIVAEPEADASGDANMVPFGGRFHYHTGIEIEPTYWAETRQKSLVDEWKGRPLSDFMSCKFLSKKVRERLHRDLDASKKDWYHREVNHANAAVRDSQLRQLVESDVGKQACKQYQKYYRHLQNYGQTLEQTKYAKGGAGVATSGFVAALKKPQTSKLEEWQRKESSLDVVHNSKQRLDSFKAENVVKPLADVHFQRHADLMLVVDSLLKTCTNAASSSAYIAASEQSGMFEVCLQDWS